MLRYADVAMDLAAHRVTRAGRPVHLGPTEFRLLRHFLRHPGRVFSREQLLDRVWGEDAEIEMRTVDVHIRRLRLALNAGGGRDLLRTVRSVGLRPRRPAELSPQPISSDSGIITAAAFNGQIQPSA